MTDLDQAWRRYNGMTPSQTPRSLIEDYMHIEPEPMDALCSPRLGGTIFTIMARNMGERQFWSGRETGLSSDWRQAYKYKTEDEAEKVISDHQLDNCIAVQWTVKWCTP